ncbi:hypothetical protein CRUP_015441 [Coryphaenoides rupestris]|nr:hypothetical protein CRUP_015441 [Coryphaenoides rupestris]
MDPFFSWRKASNGCPLQGTASESEAEVGPLEVGPLVVGAGAVVVMWVTVGFGAAVVVLRNAEGDVTVTTVYTDFHMFRKGWNYILIIVTPLAFLPLPIVVPTPLFKIS